MSTKADEIYQEGKELAKIHPNIVIKVPMTENGLKATRMLAKDNIKVNMTLIFSANQALLAAKAGASYVSPFIGRLDDVGEDGMNLVAEIMEIFNNYDFCTEIIVASVRHPIHVTQAARMGADIATIPYDVLKKMFNHPLTDIGIERFPEGLGEDREALITIKAAFMLIEPINWKASARRDRLLTNRCDGEERGRCHHRGWP